MNNSFRELNSVKTASICSYTNNVSKHTERQHQSTKVYWKPTMLRPNKNPATNEASNTHCCPEQSTTCRPMCRRHGRHTTHPSLVRIESDRLQLAAAQPERLCVTWQTYTILLLKCLSTGSCVIPMYSVNNIAYTATTNSEVMTLYKSVYY